VVRMTQNRSHIFRDSEGSFGVNPPTQDLCKRVHSEATADCRMARRTI